MVLNGFLSLFSFQISIFRGVILLCMIVLALKISNILDIAFPSIVQASEQNQATNFETEKKDPPLSPPTELEDALNLKIDFLNLTKEDVLILQSLYNYREKLKEERVSIAKETQLAELAKERIMNQMKELEKIRQEVKSLLDQYDAQEEEKLKMMVKIYESMKPQQAAEILKNLSQRRLLDIILRMKESKISPILASMDPKFASHITEAITEKKDTLEKI